MAQDQIQVSNIREQAWTQAIGTMVFGILMTVGGLIILYFSKFWIPKDYLIMSQVILAVSVIAGGGITSIGLNRATQGTGTIAWGIVIILAGLTLFRVVNFWLPPESLVIPVIALISSIGIGSYVIWRGSQSYTAGKEEPTVKVTCPFCDKETLFTKEPTSDWNCDHCSRTVHYENGTMVPVSWVICTACRAEHRVPVNVKRYLCDQCNRPLNISGDLRGGTAVIEVENQLQINFDVLLVAFDRRHINDLAYKIQNLMFCTLPEARKMIEGATNQNPLVVGYDLAERKAEAVRRELQDLGATVRIRATKK
jgi:ribosomal protein L7/L12/ribosomal protein L37AE/L43A